MNNTCTDYRTIPEKYFNSSYKPQSQFTFKYENQIYDLVEVCLPETFFYLHCGTEIVVLDENGTFVKSVVHSLFAPLQDNYFIAATTDEIIGTDTTWNIFVFDFTLTLKKKLNSSSLEWFNQIFYSKLSNKTYIAEYFSGIFVYDDSFNYMYTIGPLLEKPKFVVLAPDNNFYYTDVHDNFIYQHSLGCKPIKLPYRSLYRFFIDSNMVFLSSYHLDGNITIAIHDLGGNVYNIIYKDYLFYSFAIFDSKSRLILIKQDNYYSQSILKIHP